MSLEGDTVMLLNMEDNVRISAREVLVYGNKITYDCDITAEAERCGALL